MIPLDWRNFQPMYSDLAALSSRAIRSLGKSISRSEGALHIRRFPQFVANAAFPSLDTVQYTERSGSLLH